jgi:hypothetical protein
MQLTKIVLPILFNFGVFGNLTNLYVFTRPQLKKLQTFRLLTYLSLIDLLYVLIGIPHIIIILYDGYDFRTRSNWVCSLHSFLTIYLSHLSSNIQAMIGVFRCIKMAKKTRSLSRLTANLRLDNKNWLSYFGKVDQLVIVFVFVFFLINSHYLIWMRLLDVNELALNLLNSDSLNLSNLTNEYTCYASHIDQPIYYWFYTSIWTFVDLFLFSYIPFLIMMVSTCLISHHLYKLTRNKNMLSTQSLNLEGIYTKVNSELILNNSINSRSPTVSNRVLKSNKPMAHGKRKCNQTYKLLLTLNLLFFVSVTPLCIFNLMGLLEIEIYRDIGYFLAYQNNCQSWIIYLISCTFYRLTLKEKFNILRNKIFK